MSFMDDLGNSFINGIDRAVDSEFATPTRVNDPRTFTTQDSGTPTVSAGNSAGDFMKSKTNMMLIGGGVLLLVAVIALKR